MIEDAAPYQIPALDDAARAGIKSEGPLQEALRRVYHSTAVLGEAVQC